MNRNQRRFGRTPKADYSDARLKTMRDKSKHSTEIEEVLSPRPRRQTVKEKLMLNRCCFITPDRRSFAQLTEPSDTTSQVETLLVEQYAPVLPEAVTNLNELRQHCSTQRTKVDNCSQFSQSFDGAYWLNVENTEEIDKLITRGRDEETLTQYHNLPKNFHISEVPQVKIIAEKFTKYKKNNIEVRKLDEKIVCMEYDVFDQDKETPVQRMRAFFCIKPINEKANELTDLPSAVKNNFNISSTNLKKPNQKEVEIIDGKIIENRPYLEDLRKLLLRKQSSPKKEKNTLNLETLYQIAKREYLEYDTTIDANLLSKEELLDVQNLILENCKSSVHGIRRRTLNASTAPSSHSISKGVCLDGDTISRSLLTELMRVERSANSLRYGNKTGE